MKWRHRLDVQVTLMFVGVLSIVVSLTGWIHSRGTIINLVGPFFEYSNQLKNFEPVVRKFESSEPPYHFDHILAQMKKQNPDDLYMIVNSEYRIIAHTTPRESHIELVRKEADPDFYAVVTSSVEQKLDYILIYQMVPHLPFVLGENSYSLIIIPNPWIIDAPDMTPILFDGLRNHFNIYGWLYGAVIIFFVLFIRWRLRPLRNMEGAAHRLAQRQIPDPIDVPVKQDEVGQLVLAFNTALSRLNETEQMRRRMVSDIAHELRTPLTALSGRIEAWQDGLVSDADGLIHFTATQLEGLSRIVDDLALLSSSDAGELALFPEKIMLAETTKRLLDTSAGDAFQWQVQGNDLPVMLDPQRYGQIMLNLISNAMRAKPQGLHINVNLHQKGDMAIIRFEDNGPGAPEEVLPYLFERLYRPDSGRSQDQGGSGLGLSIVKSLVNAQSGEITCYQVDGGGLGFELQFPIS